MFSQAFTHKRVRLNFYPPLHISMPTPAGSNFVGTLFKKKIVLTHNSIPSGKVKEGFLFY